MRTTTTKEKLGRVRSVFTVSHSKFLAGEKLRHLIYANLPLAYVRSLIVYSRRGAQIWVFNAGLGVGLLDRLPPVVVDVGISMLQLAAESGDEGIGRAMKEMDVWDVEPATRASIAALKALKEVAFDGLWSIKECQHCPKTVAEGKLARMLCSHVVFHWECIESWLKDIHMCPICRFTMPSADLYSNW